MIGRFELSVLVVYASKHGATKGIGALDAGTLGISQRLLRKLPAARALLPVGDFRDWAEVEAWAGAIARETTQLAADERSSGGGGS